MTKKDRTEEGLLSPIFIIGTISVNHMEGASCFNVGNNFPTNFQSYKKHNQGFGSVSGDRNVIPNLRALLNDPDILDTVSFGPDPAMPEWVQRLINESSLPQTDELTKEFLAADMTEIPIQPEPRRKEER